MFLLRYLKDHTKKSVGVRNVGAWISRSFEKSCSWRQIDVTGMLEQVEMFVANFTCFAVTVMLVTGEKRAMHCRQVHYGYPACCYEIGR